MSKILEIVQKRKNKLDESWMDDFEELNIDRELSFMYKSGLSVLEANIIFSFIILSYDKSSGWIEMHKNRMDNKKRIMTKLGGDLNNKVFADAVDNSSLFAQNIKVWFMRYIRDWRWETIMAYFDYHSEMMKFGGFKTIEEIEDVSYEDLGEEGGGIQEVKTVKAIPVDKLAKGNIDKGSNLEKATQLRKQAEEMWEEIKKEFMVTDTVLEREGSMKITSTVDPESWEQFIRSLKKAS